MKRRTFVAGATATGISLASGAAGLAQESAGTATPAEGETMTQTDVQSGYAPVNGLQMYYEIHGDGEPLVLLHGAFGAIDLWGPILSTLAEDHQVIAVELQGHGHTADIDRPFSYEQMADDVAALMDHLGIAQADVVGYSMGATPRCSWRSGTRSGCASWWSSRGTTVTTATTRNSWPASRR